MRLAIETSTDRASVAVDGTVAGTVERELTGARRHAAGLLPMITDVLREAGTGLEDLTDLVLSDGPGSFTGLRVGASVAKALVQARGFALWIAPSLLVRARGAVTGGAATSGLATSSMARPGATILAVANALRGDIYAAAYRFDQGAVQTVVAPSVFRPEDLMALMPPPECLVGEVPEPAAHALERWAGSSLIGPPEGAPHARALLDLMALRGGTIRVQVVQEWEPAYGRPAEAQARWETAHGRPLPDSIGRPG